MNCCSPSGYESIFGAKTAQRDARRDRRKGLADTAAWLRDSLIAGGVGGTSVLEVGSGIGALQMELVGAGAGTATNLELVDSYEAAVHDLIAERGLEGQISRRIGDVVAEPALVPGADVVIMHRVICCYPDAERLVAEGCEHAYDRIAITIPRERWWLRLGFGAMNTFWRLRRVDFRSYVHPVATIIATARSHDFYVRAETFGPIWQSLVLQRSTNPSRTGGSSWQ